MFRLNATRYSWNSVSASYDGIPFGEGLQAVDHTETRDRKVVYGSRKSGKNIGVTSGKYSTAGSIKMLKETAQQFLQYLTAKGLGSYGDASFTVILQIAELEPGSLPIVVTLSNCYIKEKKDSYAEGTDELVTEFTLNEGFDVTENGMTLASRTRDLGV